MTLRYIDKGGGRIKLASPFVRIKIKKEKGSEITLNGRLTFHPHFYGNGSSSIVMGENSKLIINGNFVIGDGVKIFINSNAKLIIGGCENEPTSGITSNSLIMVYDKITIGTDFLCSWNSFITDCDWHIIEGSDPSGEVIIGNHVWVGNNCSILKNTIIGSGAIVSSYSKLINTVLPQNVMVGGSPAKQIRENVTWKYFV